jgi:hypothetical protein
LSGFDLVVDVSGGADSGGRCVLTPGSRWRAVCWARSRSLRTTVAAMVPVATSWVIFRVWGGFAGEPFFEITALMVIYSLGAHAVFKRAAGGLAILLVAVAVTDIRDLGFFGMLFALVWLSSRGVRGLSLSSDTTARIGP